MAFVIRFHRVSNSPNLQRLKSFGLSPYYFFSSFNVFFLNFFIFSILIMIIIEKFRVRDQSELEIFLTKNWQKQLLSIILIHPSLVGVSYSTTLSVNVG